LALARRVVLGGAQLSLANIMANSWPFTSRRPAVQRADFSKVSKPHPETTRFRTLADVTVVVHQSGTGKESGVPVEWDNGLVIELRDGRVMRTTNYLSHDEALEAAGLSE